MAKFFKCANGGFVNCDQVTWAGTHSENALIAVFIYRGGGERATISFDTAAEAQAEITRFVEFANG